MDAHHSTPRPLADGGSPPEHPHKWWTLGAVSVAIFMLLLDITVVNVALPDIRRDLNASFTDLQWVVDAYALTLAATLLAAGSIADQLGRRLVFIGGLGVFIAASFVCGISTTPTMLNLARGVQGVGGAMMFATSLALIANAYTGRDRGTAFGVFGAVTGGAVAIGPLIGGLITDGPGWAWIFFVNVPIGIGAIVMTLQRVAESRDPHEYGIDWSGMVAFSGALFLLVLGLIKANDYGWTSTRTLGQFIGAAALLVVFVAIELRKSHPLFDLSLFRKPAFSGASIAAFTLSASMFALFLYLTLYIQNFLHFTPLEAGLRFLPITLMSFLVAPIAGKLTAKMQPRIFLASGLLLIAIGVLLMTRVQTDSTWTVLLPGFLVAGVGIGLTNPPLASTAIGVVPPEKAGMGSGINSTFRQVGIATGIAGLGAIFQAHVTHKVAEVLSGTPVASSHKLVADAVVTGNVESVATSLPPETHALILRAGREAFISGFNTILLVGAAVALFGAIASAVLVRPRDFAPLGGHAAQPTGERPGEDPVAVTV